MKTNPVRFLSIMPELTLSALVVGLALPLILPLDASILNDDFFLYCTQHAIIRDSILRFKTLALETPYLAGGYPTVANPESPALNPLIVFTLLFGEVAGLKLIYLAYAVLAALGAYWLCRHDLGLNGAGSFAAGASLALSALFPGKFVGGNLNEIQFLTLPLGLHLLLRIRDRRSFLGLVAYGCLLLTEIKFTLIIFWLFLGAYAVLDDLDPWKHRENAGARRFPSSALCLAALLLTLLIGAAKLLPTVQFFLQQGGFTPAALFGHSLHYQDCLSISPLQLLKWLCGPLMPGRDFPTSHAVAVGPVVVAAAVDAVILFPKRSWKFAGLAIFLGWLSCARGAHPDFFRLFWDHVPLFNLVDRPAKYFGPPAVVCLCLLAGGLVSGVTLRIPPRKAWLVLAAYLAVSAPFPLAVHIRCWRELERLDLSDFISILQREPFYQVESRTDHGEPLEQPNRSVPYLNYKKGIGTLDAYVPVTVKRSAVPRYFLLLPDGYPMENPEYRGEFESAEGRHITGEMALRPNRITLLLDGPRYEKVIINRNYDPAWRAGNTPAVDHQGRLAVVVPESGLQEIVIYYRPRSFYLGLLISGLTLTGLGIWVIRFPAKTEGRRRARPGGEDPPRHPE